jgi:hypothetical protein
VLISPPPVVWYLQAIGILLNAGLSEAELRTMTAESQAKLLDL